MAVSTHLQQVREKARITQVAAAAAAGISRQAYAAIETGRSVPSTEVALRLARFFGTTVESIFCLTEEERTVQAELIQDAPPVFAGSPVQLMRVGPRLLARPLSQGAMVGHVISPADAVVTASSGSKVDLAMIREADTGASLVMAGCDPSTSILASMIHDLGIRPVWIQSESIPSLRALARGEVHVAGCNFRDRASGAYNVPLVKDLVPFPCTVLRFAFWRQGIVVNAGNPKGIRTVQDLARPDVTLVNTTPGAGSRGLLNRLLWEQKISTDALNGYDKTVRGYLAIAETVAAGLADCGIAIEAAARANDLDFVPLNEEPYDLVVPNHFLDLPAVSTLLSALKMPSFRRQVEALGGYDTTPMGTPVAVC